MCCHYPSTLICKDWVDNPRQFLANREEGSQHAMANKDVVWDHLDPVKDLVSYF